MNLFWYLRVLYKTIKKKFVCIDNFCKRCGGKCEGFNVSDDTWEYVVGNNKEYCKRCFEYLAFLKGHLICWDNVRNCKIPKSDVKVMEELSFKVGDEISQQLLEIYNMIERHYYCETLCVVGYKNALENIMEGIKIIDTTYQIKEGKLKDEKQEDL